MYSININCSRRSTLTKVYLNAVDVNVKLYKWVRYLEAINEVFMILTMASGDRHVSMYREVPDMEM